MFHLRYTHVFISNSAWFLGGETDRRTRKTAERLEKRFCRRSEAPSWTNRQRKRQRKDNATSNQTSIQTQNDAGDAAQKITGSRSMPEKTVRKKSRRIKNLNNPHKKRGVKLSADIRIFSIR